MPRSLLVTIVFLCLAVHVSRQQANPQTKVFEYYMDSHAECGKTFELGMNPATVYGKGAVQTSEGPLSCTIILSTDGIREHRRFTIELVTGFITSQGINFYIYDGQWTQDSGAQTLASFSYFSPPPTNMQRLITSGGFVTLSLTRDSPDLYGYGFVVQVTPIPADISNPNNCDQGAGYGCESYYYNPVITKSEVIYIVAAIFAVVLVIVVPSVIIYCYRRQRGLNRRWQERRLKDGAPNTAATSLNGSLRSVPISSRPWQSDISKQPFASIKKSPTSSRRWSRPPTDDDESVFDDYPRKPPPPPPPYEEHDQYRSVARNGRDYPPRRRDNYRDRRDSYDRDRDDYNRDRDRRYRERRHSGSSNNTSRHSDEKNDSFVQADDDHPQENFVERIIEPRVHPRSAGKVKRKGGNKDEEEEYSSTENVNPVKKANSETQCNRESDSEASPETESEEENSEEESVSSQSEEEEGHDPRTSVYAQPDKARKKGKKKKDKTTADKPVAAQPLPTATNLPQPVAGVPYQAMPGVVLQRPPLPGYPMMPPNPALGFMPRIGQIVRPAYPVPNQFQPAGQIQPPNPTVRAPMAEPRRAQVQNLPVSRPTAGQQLNNSGEAPKYSYLVNRGYETGRTSPVSSTTSYSQQSYVLDDSAGHIDLGSGVELMKRTTEV